MKTHWLLAAFSFLMSGAALAANTQVRVTGDRVNLRAQPEDEADVVSQAVEGEVLVAAAQEGNWVKVVPPDTVNFWVLGELVKDGAVAVSKALVRSGPGINYKSVGSAAMGEKLTVRGAFGEWLKIAPPNGCYLWVSRRFVEAVPPAREEPQKPVAVKKSAPAPSPVSTAGASQKPEKAPPKPAREAPPAPVSREKVERKAEEPAPVLDKSTLAPNETQGKSVEYEGVIRPSGLVWRRPSKYRLVNTDSKGRVAYECYILGRDSDLEKLSGQTVVVSGQEYWVQGVRDPVVVPTKISRKE